MVILILLVSFQQALIIVHFKLNQKDIEKAFCINKSKPELQCHGKCDLNKKLDQSENSNLGLSSISKKIDIALISNNEFKVEIIKRTNSNKVTSCREFEHFEPYLEIFVPPPIS